MCLIFQIITSVQFIKNNLKFFSRYLSIIQGFGNQTFNGIQLTFSKSFNLIVFVPLTLIYVSLISRRRPCTHRQLQQYLKEASLILVIITLVDINAVSMPSVRLIPRLHFCIKHLLHPFLVLIAFLSLKVFASNNVAHLRLVILGKSALLSVSFYL